MATISELVVLVTANTSQFQAGMAKAETGVSKFGVAAKVGLAIAAVAAVKFVADSVEAYNEHQEALLQLQTTIENSPALVGASTKAFEDQATALQNLTGFQDEEILKADAVLGRFGLTADQLTKVNPLILDYARATGQDAATSAGTLGKALLGNARALKAIGINFTATGKTGQDFNTILGLLESKVGGLSEAYGKTLPGQLAIAAAKFDDIKETVGKAVIPILSKLLDLVKPLIGALQLVADHLDVVVIAGVGLAAWKFIPGLLDAIAVASIRVASIMGASLTAQGSMSAGFALAGEAIGSAGVAAVTAIPFIGMLGTQALSSAAGTQTAAEKAGELRKQFDAGAISAGEAAAKMRGVVPPAKAVAEGLGDVATESGHSATNQKELAAAIQQTTQDMLAQRQATQQLAGGVLGLTADAIDLAGAQNRVNAMQEAGHDSGKKYRAALLDLLNTQLTFKNDAAELVQTMHHAGLSFDEAVDKVVNLGRHVGLTRQDVLDALGPLEQYAGRLDDIPGNVHTTVHADTRQATGAMVSLQDRLNTLTAHDWELRIHATTSGGSTAFDLINHLTAELKKITTTKWDVEVHAIGTSELDQLQAYRHEFNGLQADFDRLKEKVGSFRDTLRSAFKVDLIGGLLGIEEGQDPAAFLSMQVTQVQAFASALKGLAKAGLRSDLLQQLASQGPGALGLAQQLVASPELLRQINESQKAIAQTASKTTDTLIDQVFGPSLKRAAHEVDAFSAGLARFIDKLSFKGEPGEGQVVINVTGWVGNDQDIAKRVRDELVKLGKRNVTTGI